MKSISASNARLELRDEIRDLATAFGSMAADLKNSQDRLLAYARELESIIAKQSAVMCASVQTPAGRILIIEVCFGRDSFFPTVQDRNLLLPV